MTDRLLDLPAPAKLNLYLHVTGRRADGYHLLDTVFELIDLDDRIDLISRADGEIRLLTPTPGVEPESDLTVRAARLLAASATVTASAGVDIRLRKRIPMGAGLGGGSSDAATVLIGLNRLWNLGLARERLADIGAKLGADVPFFVFGRTARAQGIGEQLSSIDLPDAHYVLVTPPVAVATVGIFQAPELTRNSKPLKIDGLSQWQQLRQVLRGKNDLQPVVFRRFAPVADALDALRQAALCAGIGTSASRLARMSGSGSSVFLPVNSRDQALQVIEHLQRSVDWAAKCAWPVASMRRHPLADL